MSKILIVEGDAPNRAHLLAVLTPEGFEVLTAEDGLSGVELAQREQPDLVLMSMRLPGLNGCEAARRLKDHEATRHIPIIAITAHTTPAEREQALDAGCDGYLTEPIDAHTLPYQVRLFLP